VERWSGIADARPHWFVERSSSIAKRCPEREQDRSKTREDHSLLGGDAGSVTDLAPDPSTYPRRVSLPDFVPSPNQLNLDLYEIENRALDRQGVVLDAMRNLAPWAGRTVVDLGCGSGFWLHKYTDAAEVIGVEPDERLISTALRRVPGIDVLLGSAEYVPLPDSSVDVVHARFAYFFPPGCEAGFDEVMRVLRPGGTLVVVDNDLRHGEFAELAVRSAWARPQGRASTTDAWWQARGAIRSAIMSDWRFDSREDMEAVLRMEFPSDIVDPWLLRHPDRCHISYGYVLFATMKADR
jgi:SAM-dependent methyltransferase